MINLKKEYILSLITEEIEKEMGEMAYTRSDQWRTDTMPYPDSVQVPSDKVATIPPDSEEPQTGVLWYDTVRISPNNKKLIEFDNQAMGGKRMYYDPQTKKLFNNLPRNSYYGTKYTKPKIDVKRERGELDDEKYEEKLKRIKEGWIKRNILFPYITKLFNSNSIKRHLYMCGLPLIVGGKDFTEPVTNVIRTMTYNGPTINFELHSTRDEKDIQDALEKIVGFREKLYRGEDPEQVKVSDKEFQPKKHVRKYGGHSYPGGYWPETQRIYSEKYHELTPIYKLHKKAVQGGEISYNITAELEVKARFVSDDLYQIILILKFKRAKRELRKSRGKSEGLIIPPLQADITESVPDGITELNFDLKEHSDFFLPIYKEALKELGEEILQIDPDETLPDFDADEFMDIDDTEF